MNNNITRIPKYDITNSNATLRKEVFRLKKNLEDTSENISKISSIPEITIRIITYKSVDCTYPEMRSVSSYQNLEELKKLISGYSRNLKDDEINTELDKLEEKIKNYTQNKRPIIYEQLQKTIDSLNDAIEKLDNQEGSESINNLRYYVTTTMGHLQTLQNTISNFNRKIAETKIKRVKFIRMKKTSYQ